MNGRNKDMFPCPEEEEEDEEEEIETLSVTSFFPRTGALQEESKTKTQNTRKKLSRKSKNGSQLEANQTKPNQPRETKNKQNPGVSLTHSACCNKESLTHVNLIHRNNNNNNKHGEPGLTY